VCLDSENQE
jgi:hypothetical protein